MVRGGDVMREAEVGVGHDQEQALEAGKGKAQMLPKASNRNTARKPLDFSAVKSVLNF